MFTYARRFCRYQVDSGWAWVVCLASFFGQSVIFGTIQSFGTLFISLLNDFNYGESATAWVGSLGYGFLFVIGPVTTVLCEHFGCRVMACTGSLITTFSLVLTSFASSIPSMYFTFGVLWGTGGSFVFFSGLLILRFYFNKNLSFANGITMTGAGFGTLVFNIILQEVESEYGWRGGMRALSVFAALTFVGSCAFIPPPEEYMPFERPNLRFRLKRLIDPRPWRDRAFPIWVLSLSFILFAYFFPYTYLVKMAVTLGIPVSQGALLIGYFSIAAIFGKLASGRLADIPRVRRIYIFVTSAIILSVSFMCVTAAKTYHGLLAYAITAGFFDGCFVVTVPLITQDIVGKELMAKALGNLYGVVAFPLTLGPPVLGQLYKSTGSFTITFFVSAAFVLVGVSLIYVVQRLRPDLVRKPPLTMEEVIFSLTPSIHSLSVVDTLSGLCVTEPSLPASNLDPMEFASYQRFDSSPREDSRTNFVDNVPSKMATQAEIETVYRQAIERMSREMKSNSCSRKSSNISNVTRSSVPVQLSDGSARGSVMSTAAVTSDICNPSGLLIDQGEKCSLSQSSEDKTAIEEEGGEHSDVQEDRNQESLVLLDGSSTAPEGQPASTNLVPSPKDLQEENDNIKDNDLVLQTQQETHVFPQQSNVHETALEGASKEIDASQHVPSALDQGALQDNDDTKPLLNCNHPSEEEISAEGTREANEILELVRIPPPPSVPRTGRLVALGLEEKSVQDRETTSLAEPEGSLLSNASLSEISFDTGGNDQFSPREVSPPKRRRPHLAFVDQLNLLSERLEAVAARQVQEEELGDGMVVDQRPVFSPAMQSLHLTPLYSANQSVPLTPARTWSSFVNTPVPTPRHTQQSAVHTSTVPTPIPTPQTLSHSVSGVFNVCTDAPTSNIIQTQNSSNVFDVQCSPTPSQASDSGRRSGGSSLPEMGQGSMHAFGSKRSSCTGSSIANDSISVGDLNSVGEPIDVTGTATRESDGAHMNSPVNPILNEEMDSAMTNCVQHAHLQSEDRRNPFLDPCLSNHQTELTAPDAQKWANQQNESVNRQISHVHEAEGSRFNNETQASLPQHWPFIRIEMENDSSKEQFHQQPVALNPFDKDDECGIPQRQNQEDTSEVEDSDASFKLDQNIVPIEGSSNLLGFPIIKQSLDSNSDSQQGESSEVPQIPCFHKNEVCIAIPDTNDSTNRIKSDPIEVPSTQQRQLPKIAAETEQNPFLDTETKVRSQRNPFKERDLRSEVCDPTEPLHGMETDSITVPSHEIQRDFNSNSHSGQDHSFKDDQHVLFQENGLHERRGVHDDGHNFTATDAVDLTNLNSFLDPREEEFKKIYSENSPLQPITLTNAQDVTDVPQNIPHHSAVGLKTDSNNETAVLAECVFNKDTQLIYNDCTLPVDNSLKKSDRVSLSPQGAFRSQPQHGDADLVGKEMGPEDDLQETNLPTQPEPTQTELTALETIKVAGRRECDQDADSKNDWTTFSHGEEVLIFEMDTDTELTDSANSSSDSTYNKQERPFDVDQSTLFPPLQVFSDDKFLIDDHGPTTPQKLPPPPRQVQRKRIDTPISITEKLLSQSASGDSHENTKGITTEGMRKENQEEFTPKEHLTHENDTCPVLTEDDSSVAENTLSEIQSDLLSDSKLEQTNIPCSSRLSDNSISEILCEEFEADEVKEEINNPNLEQGSTKSSIHDDIAPLLMQSEESIQYLNLRDLPVDSGVLRGRTSTTSSADNSSISSTSTDSSLSENETPYCKLQECLSDSSEHG